MLVTLGSICTGDLHINHNSVSRAIPGITHHYKLEDTEEVYHLFENQLAG